MEKFDWEVCKDTRSPRKYEWLLQNFDKPVTEEQFVIEMRLIAGLIRNEGGYKQHNARKYNTLKRCSYPLKRQYRNLVTKFGFFHG